MIVTLTTYEMQMAALGGLQRILQNHEDGVSNLTHNASPSTMWQNGVTGAIGEMVIAKAKNRYWAKGERGDTDVDGFDVRTTVYADGKMLLHKNDKDDRVTLLVTGAIETFKIVGYILNINGKKQEYWDEKIKGRPCFFVPQEKLIPFTTMQDLDEYKEQCAVRQLLIYFNEMGASPFAKYIIDKKIDPMLVQRAREQYSKGNRGEDGVWL